MVMRNSKEPVVWKETLFADERGNRAVVTTNNEIVVVNAHNQKVNLRESQQFLRSYGVQSIIFQNRLFISSDAIPKIVSRWTR